MTLNVEKTVAYVAVQAPFDPAQTVQKTAAYVAVQTPYNPAQNVQKATAYVAVLAFPSEAQTVQKVAAYVAVQPDGSGHAKQGEATDRPVYRAGPDPFVEFSTGDSLEVNIVLPGTFTIVTYRPDDTFTTETLSLPPGPYTLDANFNQLAIVSGTPSSIALESIKLTMRTRAGNV